jgi:hypothetical protein
MAGHRTNSTETAPLSVNYVWTNTGTAAQSKPKPKPTPSSPPATTQVPVEKQGKRSRLRSKAKKALTSVKKSLKTVSAICFPESNHSNSSVKSRDSYQNQVRVSLISRTSTPSICLTRPTYRGVNVRLSLHQVAPSTVSSPNDSETSPSVSDRTPRAAAEAQTSLPATAPSLPYIAMAPAMVMEVGEATPRPKPAAQTTQHQTLSTSSNVPTILNIPCILAPGSRQPLAKPRARPHTTNVIPTNFLPFIPYNPRFNPYSATTSAANSPTPTTAIQKKPSAEDLAAAFAEAEAAEQAALNKRHTYLYAAVESGSLTSLIATTSLARTTAATASASSSTATATRNAVRTAPKAPSAPSNAFAIKRKPIPKRAVAAKPSTSAKPSPSTSKPLPAVPAPYSPRRFTRAIVPGSLPLRTVFQHEVREQWACWPSDRDGLPSQERPKTLSPAPKMVWWKRK